MNNIKVRDITSYSQGEKERLPRVIEVEAFGIKFKVHRHIYYPGTWLLTCDYLKIDKKDLKTDDMQEALSKAKIDILSTIDAEIIFLKCIKKVLNEGGELHL